MLFWQPMGKKYLNRAFNGVCAVWAHGRKCSVKNEFFTHEFVPTAQISQVERKVWLFIRKG